MHFEYRLTKLDSSFSKQAKKLFEGAFPADERPPYRMTISWEHSSFFGVFDQGEYVGLADVVEYQDLVYLFFLAVEPKLRNKGIGSKILEDLEESHPGKRLFLLAEVLDPKYEDYELRKRRMGFYQRNGYKDSGLIITEFEVDYSLLYRSSPVSVQEFLDVMEYLIGPKRLKKYYSHLLK